MSHPLTPAPHTYPYTSTLSTSSPSLPSYSPFLPLSRTLTPPRSDDDSSTERPHVYALLGTGGSLEQLPLGRSASVSPHSVSSTSTPRPSNASQLSTSHNTTPRSH